MSEDLTIEDGHCDDFIHDMELPLCARWFLFVHRLPAMDKALVRSVCSEPALYARRRGDEKWVRVVMASRFGDVGINETFEDHGYTARVLISTLKDFQAERPCLNPDVK
jgi:hypothetical protein